MCFETAQVLTQPQHICFNTVSTHTHTHKFRHSKKGQQNKPNQNSQQTDLNNNTPTKQTPKKQLEQQFNDSVTETDDKIKKFLEENSENSLEFPSPPTSPNYLNRNKLNEKLMSCSEDYSDVDQLEKIILSDDSEDDEGDGNSFLKITFSEASEN